MDDKQKRALDALSRLDDDIVEKQTHQRVLLLSGVRKRRFTKQLWISVGSMAAALLLVLSAVFIIVPTLAKQVPIYTGMTVSNTSPVTSVAATAPHAYRADAPDLTDAGGSFTGNHTGKPGASPDLLAKPLNEALPAAVGKNVPYTARPGEDIYITVHFDNPDGCDILSFTLNGEKYTSYMFQEGSDMENIILKVGVGNVPGIRDYTIDAIKYIDGDRTKDVKMKGDRTVRVGVYSESQPTAAVSGEEIGFDSISFTAAVTDALGLVELCGGSVTAILYDGSRILQSKKLSATDDTLVKFEGLTPDTLYQYAVIADYDALDGAGVATRILFSKVFYTRAHVLFDDVALTDRSISYRFSFASSLAQKEVTGVALYQGDTKLRDVEKTAATVDGLLPNTAYRLVAQYTCSGKKGSIELSFTTKLLTYTVRHLLQDVDGTNYSLIGEEQAFLDEGALFAPTPLSPVGFTVPAAQTRTASVEDATPVIEYRYTRNYYPVTFNVNGETTTEELLFGSPLPDTTHVEQELVGWFDAKGAEHTTVPSEAISLFARFRGNLDLLYTGTDEITITGLKNNALTDLIIPTYIDSKRVIRIDDGAFSDCTGLTSITLSEGITSIGDGAFAGCTLESFVMPDSVTEVGDGIFDRSHITSLVVSANLTDLRCLLDGSSSVSGLVDLTIPSASIDLIDLYGGPTNYDNRCVIKHLTLRGGTGVLEISDGLSTLETLTVCEGITEIGTFEYCKNLRTVSLPSTLAKIGHGAFNHCTGLTSITIPEGVTSIGDETFNGCTGLTSITLPSTLTSIGSRAFSYCTGLTSVTIPADVRIIGDDAFEGCTGLSTVYYMGSEQAWSMIAIGIGNDDLLHATIIFSE